MLALLKTSILSAYMEEGLTELNSKCQLNPKDIHYGTSPTWQNSSRLELQNECDKLNWLSWNGMDASSVYSTSGASLSTCK